MIDVTTTTYLARMLHSVKHQTSKMDQTLLVTWRFNVSAGNAACGMSSSVLHNGGGIGIAKADNGGFGLF